MPSSAGLFGDAPLVAAEGEAVVGDLEVDVLGHLVSGDDPADAQADLVPALERPGLAPGCGKHRAEIALGGPEQRLALARASLGEQRVAAGDQALAGEVRMMDLGQVALVEQRGLQRPARSQLPDRRRAQGADPVEPGRLHLLAECARW